MADAFLVRIDIEAVRRRVRWSDGAELSSREARAWLKGSGFVETGDPDWWLVEDISLGALHDGEILERQVYA